MIVGSEATWKGKVEVNGISTDVIFVFDSGGKWDFLFGKMLLEAFKAVQNYEPDEITLHGTEGRTIIHNQAHIATQYQQLPPPTSPVCFVTEEIDKDKEALLSEVDMGVLKNDKNHSTQMMNPHKPECVEELLRLVTIGDDLREDQKQEVRQLIADFADIFAFSVSEVKVVEDAVHHPDIPPGTTFPLKVHQKSLTPLQRRYLYESIDTMLEGGIIEACKPEDVKCISATTLAQKAHQGKGLALEELQHRVNDQCTAHEFDSEFDLRPRPAPIPEENPIEDPKWRICQNFSQISLCCVLY